MLLRQPMTLLLFLVVSTLSVTVSVEALGQSSDQADVDTSQDSTRATATGHERRRDRYASTDRGFLHSRAQTQPQGSWTFNNYEVVFMGVTYGITDDTQLSLTGPLTWASESAGGGVLQLKHALIRDEEKVVSVRAIGGLYGSFDSSFWWPPLAGLGISADFMATPDSPVVLSAGSTFMYIDDGGDPYLMTLEASAFVALASHFQLGLEFILPTEVELWSMTFGMRFAGSHLALDLALLWPLFDLGPHLGPFNVIGIPFGSLTLRL